MKRFTFIFVLTLLTHFRLLIYFMILRMENSNQPDQKRLFQWSMGSILQQK